MFDESIGEMDPSARQTHSLFVIAESDDKNFIGLVEYLRLEGYRGNLTITNGEPRIEVRLDRPDGKIIGLQFARFTGGTRKFVTLVTQLEPPSGVHPIFLVAKYPRKGSIGVIENIRLERAHEATAWETTPYREPVGAGSRPTETLSAKLQTKPRAHLVDVGELYPQHRLPWIVSDQANRPVIDGLLNEWNFPPLLLRETLDGIPMDEGAAKVWLSSDSQALYIAAEAPIASEASGVRPFGSVWKNCDWMEIVLQSTDVTNDSVIHGFRGRIEGTFSVMNPDNLDAERTDKVVSGVEYKANRRSGSWSAEWRIPFSALGLSGKPVNKMKCNVSMVSHAPEASRTWNSRWGSPYDLDHNGGDLIFGSGDTVLPIGLKSRFLAWFDASDLSTLGRSASGAVTAWQDRSRRNHAARQARPEHQPRFIAEGLNGKPTLAFGAVQGTYLELPSLSETNQKVMAFVVFSNPNPSSKTTPFQRLFTASDGVKDDYKVGVAASVNGVETGGPRLLSMVAANAALKQPRIGSMSPNPGTFFDGLISEIIVIGGDVSTEEKELIEAYLREKWNLTQ